LVATLTAAPAASDLVELAELAAATWLEARADLAADRVPAELRGLFPGKPTLFPLRSRAEGGAFEGSPERRRRRILEAAPAFDLVDLEAERDLSPEILAAIPAERRIVSWHGPATGGVDADALAARFAR